MTKLYTTKEVITEEGITQPIALKWAKENGVTMLGNQYVWKKSEKEAFHKRNKKRGRKKMSKEEM
ncbi:MAG: DNA-binding protein [Candidatus Stahlbacteria bacterium]|nr:MAG: DNA-binding protein [Candidatus Stahlbacteria bacterium]